MTTTYKNRQPSLFIPLTALGTLSLALSANAHAADGWIKNSIDSVCMGTLPKEVVIRNSQQAPHPGPLVVKGVNVGGNVMPGTTATAFVKSPNAVLPYEGTHRVRMIYAPTGVTVAANYINITINCESHVDKNAADYKEGCSLVTDDPAVTNVGLKGYQSVMTIRDGTDPKCPGAVSMSYHYAVQPDLDYAKRVWFAMNVMSDQAIDEKFKPGFQDLFNYWTGGFGH